MVDGPKTVKLTHRLVSVDGGSRFHSAFSLPADALEAQWDKLWSAMEPSLRDKVQQENAGQEKRVLLANYLALAPAHLIVG